MAVTIKDVAERAGVSKATVSYVLSGRAEQAKIPSETAQRIVAIAREMQYRPNALARGLTGKSTRAIRVALQYAEWFSLWSGFTSELMRGLSSGAYRQDFELVLHTRSSAQGSLENELTHILDGRTDGAVLMRNFNDPLLPALAEQGFPFVLMFSRTGDPRIVSVDCDNVLGGQIAANYLLELGHRRIFQVTGDPATSSAAAERQAGFEGTLQARGIVPRPEWCASAWQYGDAEQFAPLTAALRLPPEERPTAIFAWYDGVAVRVMEIVQSLGLRIPEDVSVLGFDGTDLGAHTTPPLTTVRQPVFDIAEQAITLLTRRLAGESTADCQTLFAPEMLVRASCASL